MSRIAVVLGTRPEIIKLAPVIELLGKHADVIHTGQHFEPTMSYRISNDLGLTSYGTDFGPATGTRGAQLGATIEALDAHFRTSGPAAVVVQGDTTSALAGALAANATDTPLLHLEAGLRSFDRRMPEEFNRVLIDHLADVCCAPTAVSRSNLRREAIPDERITVTGNTVVEAVRSALPSSSAQAAVLRHFGVEDCGYLLVTLHRPENVDDPAILRLLLQQLGALDAPVLLPLHPRTRRRIAEFRLGHLLARIRTLEPLGYAEFLALAAGAAVLVSDSGGIQEEASVLKRPIVVVRRTTERPEIMGTFGVRMSPSPALREVLRHWIRSARQRRDVLARLDSPYGDGTASRRMVDLLWRLVARSDAKGRVSRADRQLITSEGEL